VVSAGNRYIDEQAPWALRKTAPERMATVLCTLLELIRQLAIVMQPVVPDSAGRMLDQLSVPAHARDFAHFGTDHKLTPGTRLPKPEPIFPRYVEAE
jgi:methionyl-tRNA synthetase